MTNDDFFALVAKSSRKQLILGIFLLVIGLGMLAGLLMGMDPEAKTSVRIGVYVLSALILLIGGFSFIKAISTSSQLKNGQPPLANAILNGDRSFIVWYYEYIVQSAAASSHNIWLFDQNNKNIVISVKKNTVPHVFAYLQAHFPYSLVGYTDENKKLVKERLGK